MQLYSENKTFKIMTGEHRNEQLTNMKCVRNWWGSGIVQWYSESRQGLGIFLFTTASRPALGLT